MDFSQAPETSSQGQHARGPGLPFFSPTHDSTRILLQGRAHASHLSLHTGNYGNFFEIDVDSGLLMRGPRPLDREQDASHVLTVEAYNHDLGPMRSSVRVRPGVGWGGSQTTSRQVMKPRADLRTGPRL